MTPQMALQCVLMAVADKTVKISSEETEMKAELWYKTFNNIPDDKFYTAVLSAMLGSKFVPSIMEIQAAIRELNEEERVNRPTYKELPRAKADSKAVEYIMQQMGSGNIKALMNSMDVEPVLKVARGYFPDISEQMVRDNYNQFAILYDQDRACWACRTTNYCPMNQYRYSPSIENGTVYMPMVKCNKSHVKVAM